MAFWPFDYTEETSISDESNTFFGGGRLGVVGKRQRKFKLTTIRTWILSFSDIVANIAYRNREKTKVLWTGPLSVVSTPTSLNVGEAFSDWDLIMVDCNILSDTSTSSAQVRQISPISFISSVLVFISSTGLITFNRLSDTSFQISTKTAPLANISRIIGIKL